MELWFEAVNVWMMPWWIIWIWAPDSVVAGWLARRPWPVLFPILVYVLLTGPELPQLLPELVRPQLGPITTFLGERNGAFAGWIHFLVMDFLAGAWIIFRFQNRVNPFNIWLVRVLLFTTLMFGPVGAVFAIVCLPPKSDSEKRNSAGDVGQG